MPAPRTSWNRTLRAIGFVLVAATAACALYFSGWSMWHVIEDKFDLTDWFLILPMFLLFDLAGITSAVLAAYNRLTRSDGSHGVPGILVWVFAAVSGWMSATDGANTTSQMMRFGAPLVAATMFELMLTTERAAVTGEESPLGRLVRRVKARLGLLDGLGVDDRTAARAATVGKLATRAYAMHQMVGGTWRRKRAERRYLRKVRAAVEQFGLATDADMIDAVRANVAVLHTAVAATAPAAVADADPWNRRRQEPAAPAVAATAPTAVLLPPPTATATPAEAAVAVAPAPEDSAAPAHTANGNGKSARRPAAETARLYREITTARPGLSQKEYATALGISDRTLRDALSKENAR